MDLTKTLSLLQLVGSVVSQTPKFLAFYNDVVNTLHPKDQATAQDALALIQQENDIGHLVTQAKADAASKL